MTKPADPRRRDELAPVDIDAAVAVVTATVGAMFGPEVAIIGALVGPYASHVGRRLLGFRDRLDEAGLDQEEIVAMLDENESLAQLVAEAVRGTIESDLAAKRRLLAKAVIHALTDDAAVDKEARYIRAAAAIDTFEVRVLAQVGELSPVNPRTGRPGLGAESVLTLWPGAEEVVWAAVSSLAAQGLVTDPGVGSLRHQPSWVPTPFGRAFLRRLREEELAEELATAKTDAADGDNQSQ